MSSYSLLILKPYGKGLPNNGFHESDSSKSFHREWALIRKAFTH